MTWSILFQADAGAGVLGRGSTGRNAPGRGVRTVGLDHHSGPVGLRIWAARIMQKMLFGRALAEVHLLEDMRSILTPAESLREMLIEAPWGLNRELVDISACLVRFRFR